MTLTTNTKSYTHLLKEIRERITHAQYEALKVVNKALVNLYWDIGRLIIERQQAEGWGKSVVKQLAHDLQVDFPGIKGFSAPNLWRMRLFYETYHQIPKLSPLVREISWTLNLIIMDHCKDGLEKEFYLKMARKFGRSKNILIHQIENQTYEL